MTLWQIIRFFSCVVALGLTSLVALPQANAIAFSSCGGTPFAFGDAEVNVVILPYFQAGEAPRELNGLGSQLALLVKLEILYRAMAYDRWGIVLLTGPKEECDPDRIANDLLLARSIHPGGRLIMVWGKLYQQDKDVYVQTFARSYRSPLPDEQMSPSNFLIWVGGKKFGGRIVAHEFAFPPEQLPIKVMEAITDNFKKAVFLYDAPNLNSIKRPIPLDDFRKCDRCQDALAFSVMGRQGDWIQVRMRNGVNGYLVAHLEGGTTLDANMPEVLFLQGLMGYLRYAKRVSGDQPSGRSAAIEMAEQALVEYTQRAESTEEPETKAAALQLSGILQLALGRNEPSEQFDTAYQLVPYSSDARNFAAIFRLYREYRAPAKSLRAMDIANDFVAAAALDPQNSIVLANLQSFYELLTTPPAQAKVSPDFSIRRSEVEARLERVKAIRQHLATRAKPGNE